MGGLVPDLGKYAVWVLSAWGVSIVLLGGLVVLTLWRGARVRRALAAVEARQAARRAAGAERGAARTAAGGDIGEEARDG
jgi:heme exporter protein D